MVTAGWDTPVEGQAQPPAVLMAPDERRVTETDGLALSAGLGTQYVLAGVQAAYYFQLPHSLYRVVPHVAVGVGWCGADDGAGCAIGGGVLASWGHKHRAFVDLAYGPLAKHSFTFHGEAPHERTFSGPSLAVGYEYMSFGGFCARSDIGIGYLLGGSLISAEERPMLTLTLFGLGYKFW